MITSLLDINQFPAEVLAKEYHQRWEVENTVDELKTHLLGRKTHVRSQNPREVVQEVYGWLLGHWSVRLLMFQAATSALCSALAPEFYWNITSYPSCNSQVSTSKNRRIAPFFDWLTVEILDTLLPERVHRCNPRVVKKPVSKFRSKTTQHRGTGQRLETPSFLLLHKAFSLN